MALIDATCCEAATEPAPRPAPPGFWLGASAKAGMRYGSTRSAAKGARTARRTGNSPAGPEPYTRPE